MKNKTGKRNFVLVRFPCVLIGRTKKLHVLSETKISIVESVSYLYDKMLTYQLRYMHITQVTYVKHRLYDITLRYKHITCALCLY